MKVKALILSLVILFVSMFGGVGVVRAYAADGSAPGGGSSAPGGGVTAPSYGDDTPAPADPEGNPCDPDCESVANYIEEHLVDFVSEYNAIMLEEKAINESDENYVGDEDDEGGEDDEGNLYNDRVWEATSVEARINVKIFDDEEDDEEEGDDGCGYDGILLDLDDENGYILVGNDYTLLDIEMFKESPFYEIDSDMYAFSVFGGYMYYDYVVEDYVSVNPENNSDESDWNEIALSKQYDGQDDYGKGCGGIKDPDIYMKARYGSIWKPSGGKSLPMHGFDQWDLSCYHNPIIENDQFDYRYRSEGNCWVISAYHVLQYLADKHWHNMPSHDIYPRDKYGYIEEYDPRIEEPNIYTIFFDSDRNPKTQELYYNNGQKCINEWVEIYTTHEFPQLYIDVRKHVDSEYKKINGGYEKETLEIIRYIAQQYGYDVQGRVCVPWNSNIIVAEKELDKGHPLIWTTTKDSTYKNHSMAVCGYKHYVKVTRIWFFSFKTCKTLFELRDGWRTAPRFFDISGYRGKGEFIFLKDINL